MRERKLAPHLHHVMVGLDPANALDARVRPGHDD
jgi:hypothetical protein